MDWRYIVSENKPYITSEQLFPWFFCAHSFEGFWHKDLAEFGACRSVKRYVDIARILEENLFDAEQLKFGLYTTNFFYKYALHYLNNNCRLYLKKNEYACTTKKRCAGDKHFSFKCFTLLHDGGMMYHWEEGYTVKGFGTRTPFTDLPPATVCLLSREWLDIEIEIHKSAKDKIF